MLGAIQKMHDTFWLILDHLLHMTFGDNVLLCYVTFFMMTIKVF